MALKTTSAVIAVCLLFSQCTPRTSQYISVKHKPPVRYDSFYTLECISKPSQVYIFHEGEPLDFNYKRLGQITYDGPKTHQNVTPTQFAQHEASKHCANAILITSNQIRNIPYAHSNAGSISSREKIMLTAIALRIETDSLFLAQNGRDSNLKTFQKIESQTDYIQNQDAKPSFFATLLGVTLVLAILMFSDDPDI